MNLRDADVMARELMERHGLTGWSLVWDGARTRAGVCRHSCRQIGLSRVLTALHDADRVRDTVLHEIAHALVGPEAGHGPQWRAMARRLGCSAQRCVDSDAPRAPGPWVGRCPAGHEVTAYRAPQRVKTCRRCSPSFSLAALFEWRHRGVRVPMPARYAAELALLRGERPAPDVLAALLPAPRPTVPAGTRVRIVARGRYAGVTGVVERTARTRYHVRTAHGVLTVPFGVVEAV